MIAFILFFGVLGLPATVIAILAVYDTFRGRIAPAPRARYRVLAKANGYYPQRRVLRWFWCHYPAQSYGGSLVFASASDAIEWLEGVIEEGRPRPRKAVVWTDLEDTE